MPEISRFLGIVIRIYYRDHSPPHFHAIYGDFEVTVEIESGVVEGRFPRRALASVMEWYSLHAEELAADWQRAKRDEPLIPIAPLE